ncbi:Glycerophosphocholine phosphodiesterase, partial [Quaeritorhiza haematococci]
MLFCRRYEGSDGTIQTPNAINYRALRRRIHEVRAASLRNATSSDRPGLPQTSLDQEAIKVDLEHATKGFRSFVSAQHERILDQINKLEIDLAQDPRSIHLRQDTWAHFRDRLHEQALLVKTQTQAIQRIIIKISERLDVDISKLAKQIDGLQDIQRSYESTIDRVETIWERLTENNGKSLTINNLEFAAHPHLLQKTDLIYLITTSWKVEGDAVHSAPKSSIPSTLTLIVQNLAAAGKCDMIQTMLSFTDFEGRTPLHQAVRLNQPDVVRTLVELIFNYVQSHDILIATDRVGFTPFALGAHYGTINALRALIGATHGAFANVRDLMAGVGADHDARLEALARHTAQRGYDEILRILLLAGVRVDVPDENGETAFHLAARHGHVECVTTIVKSTKTLDPKNAFYIRTPLILAAMEGRADVVRALLAEGVDANASDYMGWKAFDHAVFRGHASVIPLLAPITTPTRPDFSQRSFQPSSHSEISATTTPVINNTHTAYMVYLGTLDIRHPVEPLQIYANHIPPQLRCPTYSLVITLEDGTGDGKLAENDEKKQKQGAEENSYRVDVPIRDEDQGADKPYTFHSKDSSPQGPTLVFELTPTFGTKLKTRAIARACVPLRSFPRRPLWMEREPLECGRFAVPLIGVGVCTSCSVRSGGGAGVVAEVRFDLAVIKPFGGQLRSDSASTNLTANPASPGHHRTNLTTKADTASTRTEESTSPRTMVVGHRGLGMNRTLANGWAPSGLQLGENTVMSFQAAAKHGAEFVEF